MNLSKTEFWENDDQEYDGQLALPNLDEYYNPTTFLVDTDFCT